MELNPHSAHSLLPRFTALTGYYGLTLNSGNLSADPYISTFISVAVEFPAYICVWLATQYLPRRPSLICMMLVGGLSLIFIQLVPESEKKKQKTSSQTSLDVEHSHAMTELSLLTASLEAVTILI